MTGATKSMRFFWILGLVLLVGTALGAGWVMNKASGGLSGAGSFEPPVVGIVGLGYVDVPGRVTMLHPVQPGRVVDVLVEEGDTVKKGDLLLMLDPSQARLKIREAEAALAAAKAKLAKAERELVRDHKHQIEIETSKLTIAKLKAEAAASTFRIQEQLHDSKPPQLSDNAFAAAKSENEAAQQAAHLQQLVVKKLEDISFDEEISQLRADVRAKEADFDLAHLSLFECDVYAPADGIVLQLFANVGDTLSAQPRQAAIHFCSGPPIVRVEILQEWAEQLDKGQIAYIADDTRAGTQWKGKVVQISPVFTPRRATMMEPFQYNDVRTLECIVAFDPNSRPARFGQRMRVTIAQGGLQAAR
jgi:multidrug resistance efflux pump